MLQNIREIGIFMIVAQAVVHFAPGRQYEKYIKLISNVIILLLFLKPFVQLAGGEWRTPSVLIESQEDFWGMPDVSAELPLTAKSGTQEVVKRRMEEEIATRLNRDLTGDACQVMDVCLTLTEGTEDFNAEPFFSVEILIGERRAGDERIAVDEITLETAQAQETEALQSYRLRFAQLLQMEEERVEVRWNGRD